MLKAMDKWLGGYLASVLRRPPAPGMRHLLFCVADHFEPFRGDVSREIAGERLRRWEDTYASVTAGLRDSDGVAPQHTFFYPEEEYDAGIVARLAKLCAAGHGETEIHLHHRHDTAEGLRGKLVAFRDRLRSEHGLLGGSDDKPQYAFIHGNWALCNSRPDGDWCGVDDELGILSETGCYADMTFPSAPSPTQPRIVNAIYRARDTGRPRSHDRGTRVAAAGKGNGNGDGLMLIQGPLALNWSCRKLGVLPRVENGEITGANPPVRSRVALWPRQHIHVKGRPEWVFVKVHTHGCVDENADVLLGSAMRAMHEHLSATYADGTQWQLHYVTAREMFNVIRAAEDGLTGTPGQYRDYEVRRPPMRRF